MMVHNFKELNVWKKAIDLAVLSYKLTGSFPTEEKYGLISQIQRACVSIPLNIAEGCGRTTKKELQHFISISMGSAYELETQLIISWKLGYMTEERLKEIEVLVSEVQRMLFGFYNSLN